MSANLAYIEPITGGMDPVSNDVNLQRFGWMAGPDIDLQHRSGSQFVGGFSDDLIPSRMLLRLPASVALGPFEHPATVMYGDASGVGSALDGIPEPTTSTPSRELTALKGSASRLSRFQRPPKWCAYTLMRENEKKGMCLFEHMKGWEWEEVKRVYSLIIPPSVQVFKDEFEWDLERTVIGHTVKGPFLDQVREYLKPQGQAVERLKAAIMPGKRTAPAEHVNAAKECVKQMRAACDRAWSFYLVHLNASESAIRRFRDGKPGLADYAQRDERFASARLPLDVLALANLNRTPIDLQQLGAAQAMTRDSNESMMKGFEMIADKLAAKQPQAITMEDVQRLLAERDAHWKAELEQMGTPKQVEAAREPEGGQ